MSEDTTITVNGDPIQVGNPSQNTTVFANGELVDDPDISEEVFINDRGIGAGVPTDTVYFPLVDNSTGPDLTLCAVDADDASRVWADDSIAAMRSAPYVKGEYVYAAEAGGEDLVKLDIRDGTPEWNVSPFIGKLALEAIVVTDDIMAVPHGEAGVVGLNTDDGSTAWVYDEGNTNETFTGSIQFDGSLIYAGSQWDTDGGALIDDVISDGYGHAIDPADGSQKWIYDPGERRGFARPPGLDDGTLFWSSSGFALRYDDRELTVWAVDASTGTLEWSVRPPELADGLTDEAGTFHATNGSVYVHLQDYIYSLDASDGSTEWLYKTQENEQPDVGLSVANSVVYAAVPPTNESDGYTVALDASDGSELWMNTDHNPGQLSAPAVVDGKVYTNDATDDQNGLLKILDAADGSLLAEGVTAGAANTRYCSPAYDDRWVYPRRDNA